MTDVQILGAKRQAPGLGSHEKGVLLAEKDTEIGKVRLVVRRHGTSESPKSIWRSVRRAAAVSLGAPEDVMFVQIGMVHDKVPPGPTLLAA